MVSKARIESMTGERLRSGLTQLLHPSDWRDIYAGGWRPGFFNQQWGGAQIGHEMIDGATGNLHKFDMATGYIEVSELSGSPLSFGTSAVSGGHSRTQGCKVSDAIRVQAVWVPLYKVGNPTDGVLVTILADDGTGTRPVNTAALANGTSQTVPAKQLSAKTDGEWVRFVFATPLTLSANTSYHICPRRSGALDVANYYALKGSSAGRYPNGNLGNSDGTTVTAVPAYDFCFLIEPVVDDRFLRISGKFAGKLVFAEGSPLNQSKALINPLKNFFNHEEGTLLHRVSRCVKGKPIADYLYGLDHDRLMLQCDETTGFASVRVWDKSGTLRTLTGTSDVSGAEIQDVAIAFRAKGDSADYVRLIVNGVVQASTENQTFTFDIAMRDLGHCWLGGGFSAVTWTQKLDMTSLPSANGWTWTGTGVEANCMSVSGGKLYQNKTGYGSADTGYYERGAAGFANATGASFVAKVRVPNHTNTPSSAVRLRMDDGVRAIVFDLGEYFSVENATSGWTTQFDAKSAESVILISEKGNDAFAFCNGRLHFDQTARNTTASTYNRVVFGDANGNAGENADAVYDYVAYTNTSAILPQFATGMELHEYAAWVGNKQRALPALYNGGAAVSVKERTGVSANYVQKVEWTEARRGVTGTPMTTSTAAVQLPEMESFVIGGALLAEFADSQYGSSVGQANDSYLYVDGRLVAQNRTYTSVANHNVPISLHAPKVGDYYGLHKVDVRWLSTSATNEVRALGTARRLSVKEDN